MTILERIKELCRTQKNISITTLEQELGYSNGSLAKAKIIPSNRILEISKFLGVSMEYLMTGKDDRLSERNADVDFMLLTDDDSRGVLIEYKTLDKDHREMLKKYLELLKKDMK